MHFESGGRFIPFHLTPEPFIKREARNASSTRLVSAMIMECKSHSAWNFVCVCARFFFFLNRMRDGLLSEKRAATELLPSATVGKVNSTENPCRRRRKVGGRVGQLQTEEVTF